MTIGNERSFLDQLMQLYRAGDLSATDESSGTQMVGIVQQVYLRIVLQDYAGATELMTADFEMEILGPPEIPLTGCWRGRQEVAAALERNFSLVEEQVPHLIGVSAHREAVLVMGRESGRVSATQLPYHVHWVQWFTFRGPLVCRFLQIFDSEEVDTAFGTSPIKE
ncbi:MAG: nuclear transport factor 2 family protein [Planctomycetaceae bacterium]|nr:nuclear transport factor 2 family protein [Planctomycetaceae bacterium]